MEEISRLDVKIYSDPYFKDSTSVLSLKYGFKGGTIPLPEDWVYGPGADLKHRQCKDCTGIMNHTPCPDIENDKRNGIRGLCLVSHGWTCSTCGSSRVNDEAFLLSMNEDDFKPDVGFFCCPYMPLDEK